MRNKKRYKNTLLSAIAMERTGVTNQSTIKSVALKTYGAATITFLPGCDTTR